MKRFIFFIFLIIIVLSFTACTGKTQETVKEVRKEPFSAEGIEINGIIEKDEYPFMLEDSSTGINLYWFNDDSNLYIGIETESQGWVSIGIDPENAMKGANFILMANENGKMKVRDDYGTSNFGHSPDIELGGTEDILEYADKSSGANYSYELIIPMDSGDKYDKRLIPETEYTLLLAVSNDADFSRKHLSRSKTAITLN